MSQVLMLVLNPMRADSRVEREAAALAAAGHRVTVVATAEPDLDRREDRNGYSVLRLPYRQVLKESAVNRRRVASSRLPAERVALGAVAGPRLPIHHALVASWHRLRLSVHDRLAVLHWAVWGAVLRLIRSWVMVFDYPRSIASRIPSLIDPPDVIHAHDLCTLAAAARLAGAWKRRHGSAARPRIIYDSHELYVDQNPEWTKLQRLLWQLHEIRWIGRADVVITVSPGIAAELRRRYHLRSEPLVVYNSPWEASDEPDSDVRRDTGVEPDRALVVYVGAVKPGRGVERLLPAMAASTDWELALVGGGRSEHLTDLLARAREWGVADRIHCLPAVPARTLPRYLATADAGIHPMEPTCLNHELALPNKLFDYVFAGLPVAVSSLREMKRFVEQHDLGVVFDPSDPASIADAAERAIALRAAFTGMRRPSPDFISRYAWDAQARTLTKAYEGLLREQSLSSLATDRAPRHE